MKQITIAMALLLGTVVANAQTKESMLRNLENSQSQTDSATIVNIKVDTLKVTGGSNTFLFVDSLSNIKSAGGNLEIIENNGARTLVITLNKPDSTKVQKKDLLVQMSDLTVTHDSIKYSNIDTAILRLGNRRIVFIHNDELNKTKVEFPDRDERDFEKDVKEFEKDAKRFEKDAKKFEKEAEKSTTKRRRYRYFSTGTLGWEFGFNGYVDKNYSMLMEGDKAWLDLKQARSWNFNLNLFPQSIGLGTSYVGLATAVGLVFNNYHFSNPITLKVENSITTVDSTFINTPIRRTKLSTFGFDIPLVLEFRIPVMYRQTISLSAGVIGQVRVASWTKVVYDKDGEKKKQRNGSDFNMNTLKYMLTARVGYDDWYLFLNYSPMGLFKANRGPEIYPFSIGVGYNW